MFILSATLFLRKNGDKFEFAYNELISTQLLPGETCGLRSYELINHESNEYEFRLKKGSGYSPLEGKQEIHLKIGGLVSNTITIDFDANKPINYKEQDNSTLSALPQLRFVKKVDVTDKEITIEFTDGKTGRILSGSKWDSEDWSYFQKIAGESIEEKEPLQVTFEENGEIKQMLRGMKDIPFSFMEEVKESINNKEFAAKHK